VLHFAGGKQIAEAFKGVIRERCHDPILLSPEMLAKLSFLNVRGNPARQGGQPRRLRLWLPLLNVTALATS
jgi:hypothetical protein